jgi:hypothetical protein
MKKSITKIENNEITINLLLWYSAAQFEDYRAGMKWYKEAQAFTQYLSSTYGLDAYLCAVVVAILSPNNKWARNMIDAEALIKAFVSLGPEAALAVKVCTYNANKTKAVRALTGEIELSASSPKTHAFAMNVGLNSPDHITVDKHHLRACLTKPEDGIVDCVESCTAAQYRRVEAITAKVAHDLGLKGYEFQAIVWVTIKRIWNR